MKNVIVFILVIAGAILLALALGCEPKEKDQPTRVEVNLADLGARNSMATQQLRQDIGTIGGAVNSIEKKAPPPTLPLIQPEIATIRQATTRQSATADQFELMGKQIKEAQDLVVATEERWKKKYGDLKDERDKIAAARDGGITTIGYFADAGGTGILAAAVGLIFWGGKLTRRIGMALLPMGVTLLLIGILLPEVAATARWVVPVIAAVIIVATVVFVVYELYIHRKSITQQVDGMQRVREILTPEQDKAVFGVPDAVAYPFPGKSGILDHVQDDSTKKLVDAAQDELKIDKIAVATSQEDPPVKVAA